MDSGDRRLIFWWAVLLGLTLLSFESGMRWLDQAVVATVVIIGIALIKIRIVILQFMEIADAPWSLRVPLELWILALGGGLVTLCYGVLA